MDAVATERYQLEVAETAAAMAFGNVGEKLVEYRKFNATADDVLGAFAEATDAFRAYHEVRSDIMGVND